MKWLITAGVLAALVVVAAGAVIYGAAQWRAQNDDFRARLEAARASITPVTYDAREIEGLPLPVQRYFRAVLRDGQPIIAAVRLSQLGQFRMSEGTAGLHLKRHNWSRPARPALTGMHA